MDRSADRVFRARCAAIWGCSDAVIDLEGVRVRWRRPTSEGHGTLAVLSTEFTHAGDLGIEVRLAGVTESNLGVFATGDERFDGLFVVRAAESDADVVRHLLDERARDGLCSLAAAGNPSLSDDGVTFAMTAAGTGDEEFAMLVRRVVDLTRHIATRIAALPPPETLRAHGIAARVMNFAERHGLAFRANELSAEGSLASSAIEVVFRTHRLLAKPWCTVRLRFAEPLGIGLALRPSSLTDRARRWIGRGALRLGDAAFDRSWTVDADDESSARVLLASDARSLLARIAEAGLAFTLSDEGLVGSVKNEIDADAVGTVLQGCERLRDVLRQRVTAGPYRT